MDTKTAAQSEPKVTDHYENTAKDIGNIFKYVKLLILVSFSFVMMYMHNLEWMGILLGAAINEVIITYVALDYSDSPKHHDMIIFIFELLLKFKILGEYLMFVAIVDLQRRYTNIGSPIQYSREIRHKVDEYKKMFVWNTILMLVVSFILLTSYRVSSGETPEHDHYLDFFYSFSVIENASKLNPLEESPEKTTQKIIYKVINYGWYIIKIILVLLYVYTTAILNIIAEEFAVNNTTRLYISEVNAQESEPIVPQKSNSITAYVSNAFSNVNLNYLMHYN